MILIGIVMCFSLNFLTYRVHSSMKNLVKIELIKNWQFHQVGENEWLPAEVPGTVHTDLLKNKKIGDPFYRTNESDQQWIDKVDWEYRTTFSIDADLLSKKNIRLIFKGLDSYADVFLNGHQLFSANNMFREWTADCKSVLRKGENVLTIYFHSPVKIDLPKLEGLGYQLPAVNDQSENGGLGDKKISVFARKAGYHYGWDWGPRLVTSGIWRPVFLEAWDEARIENIQYVQNHISREKAELTAVFEIISEDEIAASLTVSHNGKILVDASVKLQKGLNKYPVNFELKNPKLWWTNGLGEAFLYELTSQLKAGTKVLDDDIQKIGIRTIRVVQEKDEKGKSFYFELNGVPIFAKGANYIPNDNFLPRVTPEKYEHIIKSAADANMNMLRVWGGGIYENDIFYNLCDQYGILIWQDFMFACAMYPGDDAFLENVRQEAIQNVKRLRNHPCLALWCGNNEIDGAWSHDTPGGWGWKERFDEKTRTKIWNDYEKIFHQMLPEIVREYDSNAFYWPSSPLADWGVRASYSNASGDMHYWGVWHGKEKFDNFKQVIPRFMSEFGFQSFPEFKTIKAYTIEEDWDISSKVMAAHQRSGIGNERIKMYLGWDYKVPEKFGHILYLSQVLQAEGIKIGIEAHRRNKPYCMGTLYWQINDCWPVASWSSIDYFGRWKSLHYFARQAYNEALVSPTIDDKKLSVFIISDRLNPIQANLELEIINFEGEMLWSKSQQIEINANSSRSFFEADVEHLLKGMDRKTILFYAKLFEADQLLSENVLYFLPVKQLDLPFMNIKTKVTPASDGYQITLFSDQLAKNVYLSIDEVEGFFSDNYFDLLPDRPLQVKFSCDKKIDDFQNKLKIITIRDTY
ncbi:glycoside hydrolase family 2 protein [candidate division KSB1 bacterium]|nr:glycoside hydrolase family 2 protein [candidate division KSB1 bacterium]